MIKKVVSVVFMLLCFVFMSPGQKGSNSRYVPSELPGGFVFSGSPEFYGTNEKPLADGNIYNFMNGGGVVYVEHGFRELTHLELKNSAQESITLNIFNMGTAKNAAAAFANQNICPAGSSTKDIGTATKSYHYEPDYYMYFIKGKFLVYIAVDNDAQAGMLTGFAAEIYKEIN